MSPNDTPGPLTRWFSSFASRTAWVSGQPLIFLLSVLVVLVWAAMGPLFHYSDTWQLVINTGTTIITFLMVFLIQNTQNRDALAVQVKLDELVRAVATANNQLVGIERLTEPEVRSLHDKVLEEAARSE
jgi:low affinity Fe/Cu permease